MQGAIGTILCLTAISVGANTATNHYVKIPERNAFGLREPVAAPDQEPPQQQALPKVYLTGITTILGTKQALLVITPANPKSGDQSESVILAEGQRQGPVEVKRIDEKAGTVLLVNSGSIATVKFEDFPPPQQAASPGTNPPAVNALPATGQPGLAGSGYARPGNPVAWSTNSRIPRPFFSMRGRSPEETSATNTPQPLPTTPDSSSPQLTPEERRALLQIEEELRRNQAQGQQEQQQPLPQAGSSQQYLYQQAPPMPSGPPYPIPPQ